MGEKTPNLKRSREDSTSSDSMDSDDETPYTDSNWTIFFIIEDTSTRNKIFFALSFFAIHKGLQSTAGEPFSVNKLSSDALLIELINSYLSISSK